MAADERQRRPESVALKVATVAYTVAAMLSRRTGSRTGRRASSRHFRDFPETLQLACRDASQKLNDSVKHFKQVLQVDLSLLLRGRRKFLEKNTASNPTA